MALEHLEHEAGKKDSQLLQKQLGWTPDEAERFAQPPREDEGGRSGHAAESGAKKELDDLLKSLGLRPHQTRLQGGQTKPDQQQGLKDAGRFAPPPQWSEQYKAYTEGVGSGRK